ncbi:hypothetical protein NDU88_005211 [Pleurodeles waltl]|uniref:Uncharacterized protein n=1 Tax=Pleurodeles waltl TaxID=8319 RepID=A0AAV7PI82_PLEWA|nr:hypothetical protein NDU88_005211 [Pleurodeles waltl]
MIQLQVHAGLYTLREDARYFRCGGRAWCQRFLQEEGNGAGQPGEESAQEVERGPGRLRRAIHKAHAAKDSRSGHPLRGRPLPAAYPQPDLNSQDGASAPHAVLARAQAPSSISRAVRTGLSGAPARSPQLRTGFESEGGRARRERGRGRRHWHPRRTSNPARAQHRPAPASGDARDASRALR